MQDLFSGWWKRFILWIVSPLSGRSSLSYTHHCVMLSKTLSPHARTSCEAVAASSFRSSSVAAWPRADADCNSGTHLCCCSLLPRTGLDGALRADRGRGLPRRQSLGKSDWCLLASHLSGPSCVIFNHVSVTSMPPLSVCLHAIFVREPFLCLQSSHSLWFGSLLLCSLRCWARSRAASCTPCSM